MTSSLPILELFISLDVETDGDVPVRNSLLSLGAHAYQPVTKTRKGKPFHTLKHLKPHFYGNIEPQSYRLSTANGQLILQTQPNPRNMAWFINSFPAAYAHLLRNRQPPDVVLQQFKQWLHDLAHMFVTTHRVQFVFVAAPAMFDITFVRMLLSLALNKPEGTLAVLDMQSFLMGLRGCRAFHEAGRHTWLTEWHNPKTPHTHIADEDALSQGEVFKSMYEVATNR